MERIQSAIAKAREARENEQKNRDPKTQVRPVAPPAAQNGVAASPASEDPWKTVRSFQPDTKLLTRRRIMAHQPCTEAGPYDMLRTKLLQQMRKNEWRRVAITSPGAGSGKTMTSLNLAFSLARQSDLRVLVVELDMRKPAMTRMLGLKDKLQFSQALMGKEPAADHLLRYGANLIIAANQSSVRNSAELLQGTTAAKVLDELEASYKPDIMLFDTAPLNVSDDTLAFLDQIDCALLIAEAESATPDEIDKAERDLAARTNIIGVVLNKCRYLDRSDGYGYYYGN